MTPRSDALTPSNCHSILKVIRQMNNIVYVISKGGKPLMPCSNTKARHLLKSGKAEIVKYEPFTIRLLFECENKVQDVILGADTASINGGLSARTEKKELYSAEFKIRGQEIVKLMSARKALRQNRRKAQKRLIAEVHKILPISKVIVEVASFDIQKLKDPAIQGIEYQQGEMQEKLQRQDFEVRENKVGFKFVRGESFRHQASMNTMRWKLFNDLKKIYKNVSLTYGYITKNTRIKNKLDKSHRNDALCISGNVNVERVKE
ncbi:8026_t:CDS:2 [Funneliformis geosporum]|uniref:8026_t:CDS:1 n=1 Tax=Funneliformis geosporum TaxID=1117311 RepID=A0A9W4WM38_9GLOM|nr:8026_t:CDS:2 [Funneliformis geosporum]